MVEQLEFDIKTRLQDKLKLYFKQSKKDLQESESTDTKTWTQDHGFWSWKFGSDRYEQKSRNFATVKAGIVRISLEKLTDDIEFIIESEAIQYLSNWHKSISQELVYTLRGKSANDILHSTLIQKTIKSILSSVFFPEINYNRDFPKSLKKSGTLKGSEAEDFINESYNYINDLKTRIKKDIQSYIYLLINTLKQENIVDKIFTNYKNDVTESYLDLDELVLFMKNGRK